MAVVRHKVGAVPTSRVVLWVALLGLGQVADLLTTQAAMARGAIEANQVAAGLLSAGGLPLLWIIKAVLVAAMAAAVVLVRHHWLAGTQRRGALAGAVVWRGLQLCVFVLAFTAVHNLGVIGLLPGV
jgi:hypothetical protein